jgi:hypothetical protein
MRIMNLQELPVGPSSVEDCVRLYLERFAAGDAPWPHASVLLTAYMAWPNTTSQRDSWAATYLARFISSGNAAAEQETANESESREKVALRKFGGLGAVAKPAYEQLTEEIVQLQSRWLFVANVFQMIVDMARDERAVPFGSPSISKAVELCEIEKALPGHSQLRNAWSKFRDVAHLLTAGAFLANEGITKGIAEHEASILKTIWMAPDAVLALAVGYQLFGLQRKTSGNQSKFLQRDRLWRIPRDLMPAKPFIAVRRLTGKQLDYLATRRAPKKYKPTTAPVRGKKKASPI